MALADYYGRAALAASQVLQGFSEAAFREALMDTRAGVCVGDAAARTPEGRTLAELTVRLIARLFPTMTIDAREPSYAKELTALATSINPQIEFVDQASIGISIGDDDAPFERSIFAGSSGWDALVSDEGAVPVGATGNPFGASAAACLAFGELFKSVFKLPRDTRELLFSTFEREPVATAPEISNGPFALDEPVVIVGLGAIGNGAAWALGRALTSGVVYLVDPEEVELSNLQRYVLCGRDDDGRKKVDVAARAFGETIDVRLDALSWSRFARESGHRWEQVLVALDSAKDRRTVQATLPGWVANAWTQPGDLGLSVHGSFSESGACLACLYLPTEAVPSEDQIIADALGVPELLGEVRTLLHSGAGVSPQLADAVARALGLSGDAIALFVGRRVRDLYVEGVCGGALIPLGATGMPHQELHVPLPHQSALAGVLLAAALAHRTLRGTHEPTKITRIDVLGPLGEYLTQPALKAGTGRCICEDPDFVAAFEEKYSRA